MFLVLNTTDHEHYRTGQIVAAVGNCYLIQFDKLEEGQLPTEATTTLRVAKRYPSNEGVLRSWTPAEHSA